MASTNQPSPMAAPRDPTDAEIAHFIATRTGGQMVQLVQAIREPAAQATLTKSLLSAPPSVSGSNATPKKAKKALNAFVGFRSYYLQIPAFKPWQMKLLSGPISVLWKEDPNKSVWALLASAWSIIRDQVGKDLAPLEEFLHLVCPRVNLPAPETYLARLGWEVATGDGQVTVYRPFPPPQGSLDTAAVARTLSVEDIINVAQDCGFAQSYVHHTNLTSSTFLGHSLSKTVGTNSPMETTMQTAGPIHDERVAARNRRRSRRQDRRNTGGAPALQHEVSRVHNEVSANLPSDDFNFNLAEDMFNAFNTEMPTSNLNFSDSTPQLDYNGPSFGNFFGPHN